MPKVSMILPSVLEPDTFFKRVFPHHSMDRESAIWQFTNMYFNPASVRRMITTHKGAKGRWSREDPSFLLVEATVVSAVSLVWYLFPTTPYSVGSLFRSFATFFLFDFVFVGLLTATLLWFCVKRLLEWRYCIDIYCNAYVAIIFDVDFGFLALSVLSWISQRWIIRVFLPNTLLLVGAIHFVVLAVSLVMMPSFIERFGIVRFVGPMVIVWIISLVFSLEIGRGWLAFHFTR
jgi:hypothetical protein